MDLILPGSGRTLPQTFSVFDYDTGLYRYYKAPVAAPPLTGHYRAPRDRTPEGLAVMLPAGAKQIGEGAVPKGVIATTNPPVLAGLGEPAPETSGQRAFTYILGAVGLLWLFNRYAQETAPTARRT